MCRIMQELDKVVEGIEENHKITLTSLEIESLKRLLCSYVCDGQCRSCYHKILQ